MELFPQLKNQPEDDADITSKPLAGQPLAERMRPRAIDDYMGQEHLLGEGRFLRSLIEKKELCSLILWGPPGSGKTTLGRILANDSEAEFIQFSAVLSGVKDIREVIQRAKDNLRLGKKTVLFVDEIHRFNKAQQDAFLHNVEDGTITLIGATTENPSFEVVAPLLSRCKVLTLKPLSPEAIKSLLKRALSNTELGLTHTKAAPEVIDFIAEKTLGDAREALNTLEASAMITGADKNGLKLLTLENAEEALQKKALTYDKGGEEHYNVISAFIKSMRGSDVNAALYWLARMLEAGEDPLFIARRMVIFAAEDIGIADATALSLAVSVKDALHFVGMPEGWIPLAEGVAYLASAPKSNASYKAYKLAREDVRTHGALPVPLHLRNAPTELTRELGYGKDYKYSHDFKGEDALQKYLPEELNDKKYFTLPQK
jgi:putative ATPase